MAGAAGLGEVVVDGDDVWWAESRPDEGGRTVVVRLSPDGTVVDMVPSGVHARTGLHDYGRGRAAVRAGVLAPPVPAHRRAAHVTPPRPPPACPAELSPFPARP